MALEQLPRIFLLPTHLPPDELHQLEDSIPTLTYDVREAEVVVGNISKRERAMFELRRLKLETEPVDGGALEPPSKRRKVVSEPVPELESGSESGPAAEREPDGIVMVLKLAWLTGSLEQDAVLPVDDYLLYRGHKLPAEEPRRGGSKAAVAKARLTSTTLEILERVAEDQQQYSPGATTTRRSAQTQPPALLHESTSEHDATLPLIPAFLNTTYSCQRSSPIDPPNAAFIDELKDIRTLRLLRGDQIAVRAYSASIAALAAYPYPLQWPHEMARLPGCGDKVAELYQQWKAMGRTSETAAAATDEKLAALRKFYGIWGVGDTTAREFYKRGWRDIEDVVEHGWNLLSRVQQIGVKYYDEFQLKMPRVEVAAIANVILSHARGIDPDFQMVIVGSYRRGKRESGDADVVLSHPDEAKTLGVIVKVVQSLEKGNFITHTLSLGMRNSERGQAPLPWRGEGVRRAAGSSFDTLDKALVVWQDPGTKTETETETEMGTEKTAPHRRVDIIVSPWKTVGCAVLGWSGGTTFQRDLRRYCKREKGLKFDSSGVRRRADGAWVDLEGGGRGPAPDMETAERRVFEGLGLAWRPPEERCTG